MANSQYQYVKNFERENFLLPETYIVVRVDGRGFHRFSKFYNFAKPNDVRALNVMNKAAEGVFRSVQDIFMAYGDSDEYSFAFDRSSNLFERREAKLVSTIVSTFTAHYISAWASQFDEPLKPEHLPTFDGRAVCYPNLKVLRDYFAWRQVDCHINNLYNTTFWTLVLKGGLSTQEAEQRLCGTLSSDKNEILFSEFGINYNNESEMFKKGTIIVWEEPLVGTSQSGEEPSARQVQRMAKKRSKIALQLLHVDIIRDQFWGRFGPNLA